MQRTKFLSERERFRTMAESLMREARELPACQTRTMRDVSLKVSRTASGWRNRQRGVWNAGNQRNAPGGTGRFVERHPNPRYERTSGFGFSVVDSAIRPRRARRHSPGPATQSAL